MGEEKSASYSCAVRQNPLEEFTLFPILPMEIRLQIWHEAMAVPQQVVFQVVHTPFVTNRAFMKRVTPPSPLLHVCRESREEFQAVCLTPEQRASEDVWDIWRYFRFGVDICELRNEARVPWTLLVGALGGKDSHGLELVMGRKTIAAR